jgi:hypothetical protein
VLALSCATNRPSHFEKIGLIPAAKNLLVPMQGLKDARHHWSDWPRDLLEVKGYAACSPDAMRWVAGRLRDALCLGPRQGESEQGSAVVEFAFLALLLMVPVVYFTITVGVVQNSWRLTILRLHFPGINNCQNGKKGMGRTRKASGPLGYQMRF